MRLQRLSQVSKGRSLPNLSMHIRNSPEFIPWLVKLEFCTIDTHGLTITMDLLVFKNEIATASERKTRFKRLAT